MSAVAVGRGDYDVCLTSVPYYLWARDENPDLDARFVFMLSRRTHLTAFVVEDRPAAHGRPIRTYADLAGASLAMRTTPAAGTEGLRLRMFHAHEARLARDYLALLARLGLEPGPMVDVGTRSALEACLAGDADVSVEWVELGVALRASGRRTRPSDSLVLVCRRRDPRLSERLRRSRQGDPRAPGSAGAVRRGRA